MLFEPNARCISHSVPFLLLPAVFDIEVSFCFGTLTFRASHNLDTPGLVLFLSSRLL